MRYEQLWAPWRLGYIQGDQSAPDAPQAEPAWLPAADHDCFICRDAATAADDRRNFVVGRGSKSIIILNRYPYNNGHLLVAPLLHKARLDQLDAEEHVELMQTVARLVGILEQRMNAEGFNVGLNLGRIAGAGLPGHLHWHIVPRWNGDTNFMPVFAGARVIPQSLDALWELLSDAL
ncbi:MAG: HIT family hydrolase [Pirellula sp.]|nr:HIT family hydrolase [Pirellula sp.]